VSNTTKKWRQSMKRTLFSHVMVTFNNTSHGQVNAKNFSKYFVMYRLNHEMKKIKDIVTQVEKAKYDLVRFVITYAKLQKESDALEFLEARNKGETMSSKVISVITGKVEATLSFDIYIKVGITIISSYINEIKTIAKKIISEYGKTKEHCISKEELRNFLRSKMNTETLWRAEGFIE